MSKTMVAKFSPSEINAAVAAVSLPAALQGVDTWQGSKDVGGNPAAHLATANGKAQAIGLCQLFADFWFGAESRANILKGLRLTAVRAAFDAATMDTLRAKRALQADDMLDFLKEFTRAAMAAAQIDEAKLLTDKATDKATDKGPSSDKPSDEQALLVQAQANTIAKLQAELAQAREIIAHARQAASLKAMREALAA